MKRHLSVILLCLFIAVIIGTASAVTSATSCTIPVIKNLNGPEAIQFDRNGQVKNTYAFSAEVQGGTPPYTYTWRFGAGDENMVTGTGQQFASRSHVITDQWVVVSLQVRDSAGQSAAWDNNGVSKFFTLSWEERPSSANSESGFTLFDKGEGGSAYLQKVPVYPYKSPCSPETESAAGTGEDGIPWIPVIGIAAVAAAAIAIATRMRKQKSGDTGKKKEGPVGYILQISPSDTIKVSTREPGSFTVSAWKVDEKGTPTPANNAAITLVPPAGVPGLSIEPLSGTGSVAVTVSLGEPAGVGAVKIQVTASAGGGGTSAIVTVNFEAETSIEFE